MLVAFNVTQLAQWGYDNSTIFIDPLQPEFRPKNINSEDYSQDAIRSKLAWFYSTNAYNHGHENEVYSALEAYSSGDLPTSAPSAASTPSTDMNATTLQTVTGAPPATTVTPAFTMMPEPSAASWSFGGNYVSATTQRGAYPS